MQSYELRQHGSRADMPIGGHRSSLPCGRVENMALIGSAPKISADPPLSIRLTNAATPSNNMHDCLRLKLQTWFEHAILWKRCHSLGLCVFEKSLIFIEVFMFHQHALCMIDVLRTPTNANKSFIHIYGHRWSSRSSRYEGALLVSHTLLWVILASGLAYQFIGSSGEHKDRQNRLFSPRMLYSPTFWPCWNQVCSFINNFNYHPQDNSCMLHNWDGPRGSWSDNADKSVSCLHHHNMGLASCCAARSSCQSLASTYFSRTSCRWLVHARRSSKWTNTNC